MTSIWRDCEKQHLSINTPEAKQDMADATTKSLTAGYVLGDIEIRSKYELLREAQVIIRKQNT